VGGGSDPRIGGWPRKSRVEEADGDLAREILGFDVDDAMREEVGVGV